jgi:hypothetical protein
MNFPFLPFTVVNAMAVRGGLSLPEVFDSFSELSSLVRLITIGEYAQLCWLPAADLVEMLVASIG